MRRKGLRFPIAPLPGAGPRPPPSPFSMKKKDFSQDLFRFAGAAGARLNRNLS